MLLNLAEASDCTITLLVTFDIYNINSCNNRLHFATSYIYPCMYAARLMTLYVCAPGLPALVWQRSVHQLYGRTVWLLWSGLAAEQAMLRYFSNACCLACFSMHSSLSVPSLLQTLKLLVEKLISCCDTQCCDNNSISVVCWVLPAFIPLSHQPRRE
jgi:hypothetical protein